MNVRFYSFPFTFSLKIKSNQRHFVKWSLIEIGKDAKQPFLVEEPEKVYETSNIETDVWFSAASIVSESYLNFENVREIDWMRDYSLYVEF